MSDEYQTIYGVGLLDDIHNYFPRLLYSSGEFRTVQDVMIYVQDRIIQRFNLFTYGRRQYEASIPSHPQVPATRVAPVNTYLRFTTPVAQNTPVESALLPLLRSLIIPSPPRTHRYVAEYQDVIVHSSEEVINRASTETTLDEDIDNNCSICQDRMRQGEIVRTLICRHAYHRACIDNWLLNESVLCPTCRHDIREPFTRSSRNTPQLGPAPTPSHVANPAPVANPVPVAEPVPVANPAPVAEPEDNMPNLEEPVGIQTPPIGRTRINMRDRNDDITNLLSQELWNSILFR